MSQPYYTNEHGADFLDYLAAEVFTKKEMKVIAKFNALKYDVRAGKKPNNTAVSDIFKRDNYIKLYTENDEEYKGKHIREDVRIITSLFDDYKGK